MNRSHLRRNTVTARQTAHRSPTQRMLLAAAVRRASAPWLLACLVTATVHAQAPVQAGSADASHTQKPSTLLQPALDSVARAGSNVDLNKWKGPTGLKSDVDANLASMQKDVQTTLPPLLAAADAAPDSASASLPLLLNLDALYSVLLRITIASRSGAPRDENTSLEQSAVLLDSARRDLGDAVLAAARAQEKRSADLQATVQQQADALKAMTAPVSVATPVAAKPKPRKKPTQKPAAKPAPAQ